MPRIQLTMLANVVRNKDNRDMMIPAPTRTHSSSNMYVFVVMIFANLGGGRCATVR